MPDDGGGARRARDAAMKRVADRDPKWQRDARTKLRGLLPNWKGTGEDIRLHLTSRGLREPHHPNAWGAVINTCLHHGWLQWTGDESNMKTERSHARSTKIYRRTHKP